MELKYRFGAVLSKETLVLIVPLWNWNDEEVKGSVSKECSNCTFMELKYNKKAPQWNGKMF